MALEDTLRQDLTQALRQRDQVKRDTLRLALAAIKNAEIEQGRPLGEADLLTVLAKEARLRRESIEAFTQGKRPDLVVKEEAELKVLLGYLPQPLSREELVGLAQQVIVQIGAQSLKEKGKVMSQIMPQVRGRAEGSQVNEIVTQLLSPK